MQWLDLHRVGFGECIVLGGRKKEILMVDCGCLGGRLENGQLFSEYVRQLAHQYGRAKKRTFLLTHFHKDHYSGLPLLLKENPGYFGQIFLPNCPLDEKGMPLLLELAILIECFLPKQAVAARMNVGALRVFDQVGKLAGPETLYTLKEGDHFSFDGVDYEVLWPRREPYPFGDVCVQLSQEANRILLRQHHARIAAFLELKEELCMAYVRCMNAFSQETDADEQERWDCMEDLCLLVRDLDAMIPALHLLPVAERIADLFCSQTSSMAYHQEVNGASLIFQNCSDGTLSYQDILMTGDAAPFSLDTVAGSLRENYYIVKAPHHGTRSGWWPGLEEMGISHILISNGASGGGRVDPHYPSLNALHHCTSAESCDFAQKYGCCNAGFVCPESMPQFNKPTACLSLGCGIQIWPARTPFFCNCDHEPDITGYIRAKFRKKMRFYP